MKMQLEIKVEGFWVLTSPRRWWQCGPTKCHYPTLMLHSITTQKTVTWFINALKTYLV